MQHPIVIHAVQLVAEFPLRDDFVEGLERHRMGPRVRHGPTAPSSHYPF